MKIQTKISSIIFILILVTGIVAITSSHIVSKQMIETGIYHHLESIAISRAHHIETLLDEEVELVKISSTDTAFIDALTSENITHAIRKIKALIDISDEISRIIILDKQGNVVVSSHSKIDYIGDAEIFAYGKEGIYIRDTHISTITATKVISISAPILVKNEFVGIIIVGIEVGKKLYEILSQRHEKTDDIYLINKDGYMITPSRFIENTFLKMKVDSLESRECFELSKKEQEIEHIEIDVYEDYRGELVIGTHRVIKGMDWCLLAEIDAEEAFAPVNRLVRLMFLFLIVLLGVSSILAFFTAKNITRPILKLRRRTEEIEKGNWDCQFTIDTQDEIGQLSRAFDSMTTRLKNAQDELRSHQDKLEIQVAERTTELSQRLQEIELQKVAMQNLALTLEANQQRYESLVNSIDGVVWEADAKTFQFQFVSQQAQRLLGYPLDDWLNQPTFWANHTHPDDREWATTYCVNATKNKQDHNFEYRMITADNRIIWLRDLVTVVVENDQAVKLYGVMFDITENKQAEQTLRESEERFRALFEGAPDAIFLAGAETGKIIDANPAASQLLLRPREEIIGMHQSQLHPPSRNEDSQKKFSEQARLIQKTKQTSHIEYVVLRSDGVEVPVEISGHVLNIQGKSILQGVFRDITERKRAEMALQESEERFRAILDNSTTVIFLKDVKGRYLFINKRYEELFQISNAEINGKTDYEVFPEKDADAFVANDQKVITSKSVLKMEEIVPHSDGFHTYISIKFPLYDAKGNIYAVCGMATDITERKQAERALRNSEEQFRKMFEEGPIGMVIATPDLGFTKSNAAFCQMLGYTEAELLQLKVTDISYPDDMPENRKLLKKALNGEVSYYQMEKRYIRKDGKLVWGHLAVSYFYNDDDEVTHLLAKVEDITERKQVEIALKQAKEEADSANRAKSEFLANMSHEIRTPMNAVLGFSDILASKITDIKHKTYLNSIQTAGKSLLTLINDILDLSKIEAGRLEIQYEPVNPQIIFTELQQIFSLKIAEKNLELIMEIDDTLPPALFLDETRLRQVLLNLIGNAVKFTDSGYIKLCANKRYTEYDHSEVDLILAVEDSGIGIPADQQALIFESFRQQDGQSTRKYGGTGLGLAISKRLVEMMNGHISIKSSPGKGSRFEIALHEVKVAAILPAVMQYNIFDSKNITFEKVQVLVVDDIESNRDLIEEYLSQVNLEIVSAENGHKALLFAEEYHPALILMDIKMPEMDGYEATKHLKNNPNTADIPVIALTASVALNEKAKIEAHSFDGYLAKPVNISELLSELSRYLKHTKKAAAAEPQVATMEADSTLNPEDIADLPKLRNKLKQKVIPLWEEVNVMMEMDVVAKLAKKMIALGSEYNIPVFIRYGEPLLESTQNFDIAYIQNALEEFPVLVKPLMENSNSF